MGRDRFGGQIGEADFVRWSVLFRLALVFPDLVWSQGLRRDFVVLFYGPWHQPNERAVIRAISWQVRREPRLTSNQGQ